MANPTPLLVNADAISEQALYTLSNIDAPSINRLVEKKLTMDEMMGLVLTNKIAPPAGQRGKFKFKTWKFLEQPTDDLFTPCMLSDAKSLATRIVDKLRANGIYIHRFAWPPARKFEFYPGLLTLTRLAAASTRLTFQFHMTTKPNPPVF
jgi:hypothetical protein